MGIFSFLTSNKTPDRADEKPAPDAPAASRDEPPRDAPIPPLGQGPLDQPFTPPDAWNTEALTQPPPARSEAEPKMGPPDPEQTAALQAKVIEVIKTVYDPEIPVDIYELGLIYDIIVDAERNVLVKMTLTSPACPSAQQIPSEVRYKVKALPEVTDAWVEIEWEPMWTKDRMSEAAKLALGIF